MKNQVKIFSVISALVLLLDIGCTDTASNDDRHQSDRKQATTIVSSNVETGPKAVLIKYINAELRAGLAGRSKETYEYISRKDKAVKSLQEYLSSHSEDSLPLGLTDALFSKISYSVKDVQITDDVAKAEVEFVIPAISKRLRMGMLKEDRKKYEDEILQMLQGENIPMERYIESYNLIKEDGGWRIFLDFGTRLKVNKLIEEGEELVPSLEILRPIEAHTLVDMEVALYGAQKKYEEVLKLDEEDFRATSNLKYLNEKIEKLEHYKAYKKKVTIRNIKVAETTLGGLGVFGEVKNGGDSSLTKVGITIYFLDKKGNPIHEKTSHPIYVTTRSYGRDDQPLKPNYSRKFGVKADDAPSDWSRKVKVVISDLEFARNTGG